MIYLEIFLCYLKIGFFSFGGGHAAIPLVKSLVVEAHAWFTMEEFMDMITIAEMTPGPFALNSATFVGMRMGGILGGALATFACMLPSFGIALLLAVLYQKYRNLRAVDGALTGIRPAVTAMIASAGLSMLINALFGVSFLTAIRSVDWIALLTAAGAFAVVRTKKLNPVAVILLSGLCGGLLYTLFD